MFVKLKKSRSIALITVLMLVIGSLAALDCIGAFADTLGIDSPTNVIISPTNDVGTMSVDWWDSDEVSEGYVVFASNENLTDAATAAAIATVLGNTTYGYSSFEASMTGLSANEKYYYKVGNDGSWSDIYSFTTQDTDADKFNFLFLGDVQYSDVTNAQQEYDDWAKLVSKATADNDFAFGLLAGDMVQANTSIANWNMFLGAADDNFSSLPMLAVTGNHETNGITGKPENMMKYLALPTNGPTSGSESFKERFYSYDYGNTHITVLDSNVFSGEEGLTEENLADVKAWIKSDLENSSKTWKIVAMHHPAYSVVSDAVSQKVMANWVDLFEEEQVDLVFCGHQHIYMRTYPMFNGKKNPNGITYVMGDSGSKFYAKADHFYSAKMIENTSTYQVVSIDGNSLTLKTCDKDGNEIDTAVIMAHDRSTPIEDITTVQGDVNSDGLVNSDDYDLVIDAILNYTANDTMDVNGDGKVNISDAHFIMNVIIANE